MIEIGYVYLACGFVLLAIIINVAIKFDAQTWISRDLSRGDLYSLVDVASGLRPDGLSRDQANRLWRGVWSAPTAGIFAPRSRAGWPYL